MKMKSASKALLNRNFLMLVVAAVLGVGGVYLTNKFIESRIAEYEQALKGRQKMIEVVVPNRNLPRGTRIRAADLAVREVPAEYVHRGVVTEAKYRIAEGQRLAFPVDKGKPLLWAHLETGSVPTFSGKLPEGYRALTFPVDEINSVSGLLQPKDRIDLILTYRPKKDQVTVPLLQNVLVLATGTAISPLKYDQTRQRGVNSHRTITVQVTPEDAERIILAQAAGKITAVLRHPDDKVVRKPKYMTVATLFGDKKPKRNVRRRGPGIRFIIGGK